MLNSASYCCSVRPKVYVGLCVGKNIGNFYQVSHPNDHLRDPQLQRIAKPHKPLPIYTGVNCRNIIANWLVFHLFWLYYITEKLASQICMHCSLILTVLIDTCLHQKHPLIYDTIFHLINSNSSVHYSCFSGYPSFMSLNVEIHVMFSFKWILW